MVRAGASLMWKFLSVPQDGCFTGSQPTYISQYPISQQRLWLTRPQYDQHWSMLPKDSIRATSTSYVARLWNILRVGYTQNSFANSVATIVCKIINGLVSIHSTQLVRTKDSITGNGMAFIKSQQPPNYYKFSSFSCLGKKLLISLSTHHMFAKDLGAFKVDLSHPLHKISLPLNTCNKANN